jgi:hypothetical protein
VSAKKRKAESSAPPAGSVKMLANFLVKKKKKEGA